MQNYNQVRMLKIAARMFGMVLKPSLPINPINRKCFSQQKQEKSSKNQKLKAYIAQNPDTELFLRKANLMAKLGFVGTLATSYAAFLIVPGISAAIDPQTGLYIWLASLFGLQLTQPLDDDKRQVEHKQSTFSRILRSGLYGMSAIGAGIHISLYLPNLMASPFSQCLCIGLTASLAWLAKNEAFVGRKYSLLKYDKILGGNSRISGIFLFFILKNLTVLMPVDFLVIHLSVIGYYFASIRYEVQNAIRRHKMGDRDQLMISASLLICILCIYLELAVIRKLFSERR